MSVISPSEQVVEDVTGIYFGIVDFAIKRGAQIDDAGERANLSQSVLQGRLLGNLCTGMQFS